LRASIEALDVQARGAGTSGTETLASGPLDDAERVAPLAPGLVALERARTRLASLQVERSASAPEVREQERTVARLEQVARASGALVAKRDANERAHWQSMVGESQVERARTTGALIARSTLEPVRHVLGDFNSQLLSRVARLPARRSRLVSPPSPPERQPSLLETQGGWSVLAGALAGLQGVVLEQTLGRSARFRRSLTRRAGPHWLAELPHVSALRSAPPHWPLLRPQQLELPLERYVALWKGAALDQWRRAVGQLHLNWQRAFPQCRLWCITSPGSGDGQTSVARALALTAATRGQRVLLVSARASGRPGAQAGRLPPDSDVARTSFSLGGQCAFEGDGGWLSTRELPESDGAEGTIGAWLESQVIAHDVVVVDTTEALQPLLPPSLWPTAAWLLVIRAETPERHWGPHLTEVSRTGSRWGAVSNAARG
jgi:hypothetical protein